ncbi:MAG: hypothetical protein ABEK02_00710 [Haloquadratum sp.]
MRNDERGRSGKRVLGVVIAIGVAVGAGMGLIVGTSPDVRAISLFDVVVFRPTPLGMAVYGAAAATAFFAFVFGIVAVLSRFDSAAER